MAHQLGPELPTPFSVVSENYVRCHTEIPDVAVQDRYSFGAEYNARMCELIDCHLELDTQDELCYVGDPKASIVPLLQQKFCLLKPVTAVIPGHIHYTETPNHKRLHFRIATVGAEDYFRQEALKANPDQFDKILIHNAVNYIDDCGKAFANMEKCLKPRGQVLIIHRAAPINSLPVFNDVHQRFKQIDRSLEHFIRDLQNGCIQVTRCDLECLPVRMPKERWYAMLKDHYPHQLETVSDFEVNMGLRELSEGMLKYLDGDVHFVDRLLFVPAIVTYNAGPTEIPEDDLGLRQNDLGGGRFPCPPAPALAMGQRVKYQMEITPKLQKLVRDKQLAERMKSLAPGKASLEPIMAASPSPRRSSVSSTPWYV